MLPLEATKLSADPKFSVLARHAINLGRAAWFWSSLERYILHQSVFQIPFSSVVDLLKTFCMFLQCILQSAFCTDRMLKQNFGSKYGCNVRKSIISLMVLTFCEKYLLDLILQLMCTSIFKTFVSKF